ncbi:protein STRUBBELIG-RECEPTOR FAMILY 3 isoform X1 [Amborella trichopoda]|uniref:Protein kinase domain-containing protein n=1 Tax=Amborella trichopoda TaxID=13333 RepID=W1P0P9_AMBTC|nr:protein STRUBBELIG-RECEPTOR FAMILY 3 isoform X1 [Amborella trichopoda]XP_020521281.1 protein STRUBBELIG-RECEPTOR FAMILY 3 isoform X1 [Amborella trichopoda]XP_020521282.1 protein STRUBBELIG-RECEPTOR FAMILY 3 isoform X1 [Amborella trichopoda]ERN03417.1 hypothetical protein AMTR_s00003p00260350 [Amborella trichopoda]|eukprot:XP_006841742.1 protein STRUBBELIG-RECEPTOR FAMILY 3 isoform X1 [Amborella trichopoda]
MGNLSIIITVLIGALFLPSIPFSHCYTDVQDVFAINSLYAALDSPPIPGWVALGGDPCGDMWQGVQCTFANITAIVLNAANLGGQLGAALGNFTSLITINLSNNHIGATIPDSLPPHLQQLFLSDNQFIGTIPSSLSELSLLLDMSLNDNLLTGPIPDAFQALSSIINLDLSNNNITGQLPASMQDLSSLTTLHLQNNQLSGILDVLENLPLKNLHIENNLFSGPIPPALFNIPDFVKDGNPFNTTPAPSPPPHVISPPPISNSPVSEVPPRMHAQGPSSTQSGSDLDAGSRKFLATKNIVGLSAAGAVIIAFVVCSLIFIACRKRKSRNRPSKTQEMGKESPKKQLLADSLVRPSNPSKKDHEGRVQKQGDEHHVNMVATDANLKQPPGENATKMPVKKLTWRPIQKNPNNSISAVPYTIASLQQFTNSFAQENLIGEGSLGRVYRAKLFDGKLLAVKKLDIPSPLMQSDETFLELVSSISKLRHVNIAELVGYCSEHGQQLLVYEYYGNRTLHEALHLGDEVGRKLSWNVRLKVALGVSRALAYLHEACEPPVAHQNFKSANILFDEEMSARLSDCGLSALISSDLMSPIPSLALGSFGYSPPEVSMSGAYTLQSDVYCFGVVMLELLTGRKPFDRERPRGEHSLVRWAAPQLHDIEALSKMVDPALSGNYPAKSLSRFADIISLCVQPEPEFRPPMSEIVQALVRMIQRENPTNKNSRSNGGLDPEHHASSSRP